MKVKANIENQTVSIKGMTPVQAALIEQLLSHVRLGDNTEVSDAAYELLSAFERCDDLGLIKSVDIQLCATTDDQYEDVSVWLTSPTLIACVVDCDECLR